MKGVECNEGVEGEGGFLGGGGNLFDHLGGGPRMRYRREADDEGGVLDDLKDAEKKVEETFVELEHEAEDAVAPIAETVGMQPW